MNDTAARQEHLTGDAAAHTQRHESPRVCVAYLINQYPKLSHAFIRREIAALESLGLQIRRFSIRHCSPELLDEADKAEFGRTEIVLQAGFLRFVLALLSASLLRPRRFARALWLTLCIGWRSDRGMFRNLAYLAEATVLLRRFRQEGVTHVHAHFGTNPAAVAMLCYVLGGPQYSFTAHGPDEFDRGRYLAMHQKIAHAQFVITVSSFGRSQLYRLCDPGEWHKIHVLHPGIEDALLSSPPSPFPSSPNIVCVGRLHPDKGQLILIQALSQLAVEGVPCELVLVGDGPLRDGIRRLIAELHLERRITLAGAVSSEQLCRYVQDARVVVIPSFAENLPSVIMEAFALGRPVIATAIAGIPELVEPGACGWLVPAGSVEALASAIREALETPIPILEAMGSEGVKRVRGRFRSSSAAQSLIRLFGGDIG